MGVVSFERHKPYYLNWQKINESKISRNVNGIIQEILFTEFSDFIFKNVKNIKSERSLSGVTFHFENEKHHYFCKSVVLLEIIELLFHSALEDFDLSSGTCLYYLEFDHYVSDSTAMEKFFIYSRGKIYELRFLTHSASEIIEFLANKEDLGGWRSGYRLKYLDSIIAYRHYYDSNEYRKLHKVDNLFYGSIDKELLINSDDVYRDLLLKSIIGRLDRLNNIVLCTGGVVCILTLVLIIQAFLK